MLGAQRSKDSSAGLVGVGVVDEVHVAAGRQARRALGGVAGVTALGLVVGHIVDDVLAAGLEL